MSGPLGAGCCGPLGGGGGGGAVDSVFGRTGIVVAEDGDYNTDQVDNASTVAGTTASDALETLADRIGPTPVQGTDITGDITLSVADGSYFRITSLAANITIHLSVAGPPRQNQQIVFDRTDASAFTVTFINDGPLAGTLLTMPVSTRVRASFSYAAGDFYPGGNYNTNPFP